MEESYLLIPYYLRKTPSRVDFSSGICPKAITGTKLIWGLISQLAAPGTHGNYKYEFQIHRKPGAQIQVFLGRLLFPYPEPT